MQCYVFGVVIGVCVYDVVVDVVWCLLIQVGIGLIDCSGGGIGVDVVVVVIYIDLVVVDQLVVFVFCILEGM